VSEGEPRMSLDEHAAIVEMLRDRFGLAFSHDSRPSLERRLRERLVKTRTPSFTDYVRLLRGERAEQELAEAADLVTVNETYLLREEPQLRAFADDGVALLGRPKRISIWSAGCSTGEETYSIAIALLEAGKVPAAGIRIAGTDVSRRCIQAARRSVFGASAFRVTSDATRRRWFVERSDGAQANDELRQIVHFSHMNLLDRARASLIGTVDVVFCRNVLIYMDDLARSRIVTMFHEMLTPGGLLLLGHSESLLHDQQRSARLSWTGEAPEAQATPTFEPVHLRSEIVYRKPLDRHSPPGPMQSPNKPPRRT
jgi:chemotaxis protein methyltransferase CheR